MDSKKGFASFLGTGSGARQEDGESDFVCSVAHSDHATLCYGMDIWAANGPPMVEHRDTSTGLPRFRNGVRPGTCYSNNYRTSKKVDPHRITFPPFS